MVDTEPLTTLSSNFTYGNERSVDDIATSVTEDNLTERILTCLKIYITPGIAVAGIIGNVLSCVFLLGSKLRTFSSSHYLSSLILANSFYLIDYLIKWLNIHDINLRGQPEFCQVMNFLENVSAFLSNWFMVTYCVDRYICMAWPMEAARMCNRTRARVVIACVIIVATILHFNMSITMAVPEYGFQKRCMVQLHPLVNPRLKMAVDMIFNIAIPYFCCLVIVTIIGIHSCTKRRDVYSDDSNRSLLQCTTLALLISYVVLHLPYEFYRIVFITRAVTTAHAKRPAPLEYVVQAFLSHFFRLGMAIHLVVLLGTYPLFRTYCKQSLVSKCRSLLELCKCFRKGTRKCRSSDIEMTYTEVNGEADASISKC